MKKRKKYAAVLLLSWALGICPAQAAEDLELYARSAVLMDGSSGRILYGKGEAQPMPMASTTKIMTCILALEEAGGLEGAAKIVCAASAQAASQPQVKLGMQPGETFYLSDLLYSLMLESHNDTAVCIGETLAGSVEGFAEKMNEKAREIGCEDTYYITPNGLDASDREGIHHTTAEDLALVMRYCLALSPEAEDFVRVTSAPSYTFTDVQGSRSFSCSNHNAFLNMMEGALSGKTGYTADAGYCYVGALKRDDTLLIVSLLACGWPGNKGYKWIDTRKLMEYGLEHYRMVNITEGELSLPDVIVRDGQQETVKLTAQIPAVRMLMKEGERVQRTLRLKSTVKAPLSRGQEMGQLLYLVEGVPYAGAMVTADESVGAYDYSFCLERIVEEFCL